MQDRSKPLLLIAPIAFVIASVLIAEANWNPWSMVPPLAGIFDALAVASLALFVLAAGRSHSHINFVAILLTLALGRALLAADLNFARVLLSIAHIGGIAFFIRHRRLGASVSQTLAAVALVILVPLIVWLSSTEAQAVVYSILLGAMAAASWLSRFPRYITGLGAVIYVASDIALLLLTNEFQADQILKELLFFALIAGLILQSYGIVRTFRHLPHPA